MALNPYARYTNSSVFTATKEDLVLMLYDGAVKFANQALTAIEGKDFKKANEAIIHYAG
jgi:flagellar protein FliS